MHWGLGLTWNIHFLEGRTQQWLYFLGTLKIIHLSQTLLLSFYHRFTESNLTYGILVWFECSSQKTASKTSKKKQKRIIFQNLKDLITWGRSGPFSAPPFFFNSDEALKLETFENVFIPEFLTEGGFRCNYATQPFLIILFTDVIKMASLKPNEWLCSHDSSSDTSPQPISGQQSVEVTFSPQLSSHGAPARWIPEKDLWQVLSPDGKP